MLSLEWQTEAKIFRFKVKMSHLMLFVTLMLLLLPLAPHFQICMRGWASMYSTELKYITDKEELLPFYHNRFCFESLRMRHNPNQGMSLCLHALTVYLVITYSSQSTATRRLMSWVGSPTAVRISSMVTSPALGILAAPTLARVAVILMERTALSEMSAMKFYT